MNLIIRKARLRGREKLVDIGIENGRIAQIQEEKIRERSEEEEIDAQGRLVTSPFVDPHTHLDTALTVGEPRANVTGTLLEGIEIWAERKAKLTVDDVKRRAAETIRWQVAKGTLAIRSHVDICDPNQTALKALLELKREYADLVDLQLVAFPQMGIISYPNGEELMVKALEAGADVVGGIPHYEWTREDGVREVELLFELAKRFGRDIDAHIDETDDEQSRFTEVLAARTIKEDYSGRVSASHTTAMGSYNGAYAFKLMRLLSSARVNVITNPLANSVLQGRFDSYPKRRGLTRVKELLEAGVNVCIGHDSIMDPVYPFGVGDMLQAAFVMSHMCQMTAYAEVLKTFDMVTVNSARALRIGGDYGVEVGKKADLVVLDAYSELDALRLIPSRLYVVKSGRIVARTTPTETKVYHKGAGEKVDFFKHP